MHVQKYFSTVPDAVFNNSAYCSAYRVFLQFYSVGLSPELRSNENAFPSVTLCNCIHTILDTLSDKEKLRPYLDDFHQQLQPDPEAKNPRPETISAGVYDCQPTTGAERCAVMALACAVGAADESLDPAQVRQFKRWLFTHKEDYAGAKTLHEAFPAQGETAKPIPDSTADLLSDYCIGITTMDSIERAMSGMNAAQKDKFMSSVTEMFLGDSYRLNRLIGGMMVYRYDILSRENRALEAGGEPGTRQPIASDQPGTSKQATTRQLGILFRYLLGELGIDFTNSDKSEWARLVSFISGYDSETLRKKFDLDYDSKQTQKDMEVVSAIVKDLMPGLAHKIEKDKKG